MNEQFPQKNERFAHFLWPTWAIRSWLFIFGERPEQFGHIAHFWWVTWAIQSHRSLKKREWVNRNVPKNTILVKFFKRIACLLIYHERPERIANGCSFVMSDLSNSLIVTLLTWATWAIRSQLLICPERSEQIAHSAHLIWAIWANEQWANERWANERILRPDFLALRMWFSLASPEIKLKKYWNILEGARRKRKEAQW